MFWNFPDDQQVTMKDGIILWMNGRMDPWISPQRLPQDPADVPKVIKKLWVAREKGYIDIGLVCSLKSFLKLLKGYPRSECFTTGSKVVSTNSFGLHGSLSQRLIFI
jgi:hypothetical protein